MPISSFLRNYRDMSRQMLVLLLLLFVAALGQTLPARAERALFPSDLYHRTNYYYGQPPTYPRQPAHNVWYQWGYFGAYPEPRTYIGGHYSHRNHYHELRFSAPR